ncbi:MAG: hypothetical protein ACT4QD_22750 [Acidobacteriota bacterium]
MAAATAVSRFVEAAVSEISPSDPLTLAAVAGVLVLSGGAASVLPAWRAMRTDPLTALRSE